MTKEAVEAAHRRIAPLVRETPLEVTRLGGETPDVHAYAGLERATREAVPA